MLRKKVVPAVDVGTEERRRHVVAPFLVTVVERHGDTQRMVDCVVLDGRVVVERGVCLYHGSVDVDDVVGG